MTISKKQKKIFFSKHFLLENILFGYFFPILQSIYYNPANTSMIHIQTLCHKKKRKMKSPNQNRGNKDKKIMSIFLHICLFFPPY